LSSLGKREFFDILLNEFGSSAVLPDSLPLSSRTVELSNSGTP